MPLNRFRLHRRRPEVKIDGTTVPLSWRAWQLLGFLYDADGEIVSNDELCELFDLDIDGEACNGHILRIVYVTRQKLRAAGYPDLIEMVYDRGYRLKVRG